MKNKIKQIIHTLLVVMICQLVFPMFTYASSDMPIIFEAEEFAVDSLNDFEKVEDSSASGGYSLKSYRSNSDDSKGYLEYSFEVTKTGYYNIWIRSKSQSTGSDSMYYLGVNSTSYVSKSFPIDKENYLWSRLERAYLNSGTYKIRIKSRENNGFLFDKLLITNMGSYIPSGTDGESNSIDKNLPNPYGAPKTYPPEDTHPRVLVNDKILAKVKANLNHPQNAAVYDKLKSYASSTSDGTLGKDTDNFSSKELAIAESLAFMYLIDKENNKEYGKRAITNIKNICDTVVLTTNSNPTRAAGYIIYVAALVYDWCYDLLDETEKEELIGHMVNLATTMEIGWPATKQGNFVGHGSESQLLKNLFAAAIAIYDEYPEAYELIGGRLYNQMIPARNEFMYKGHYFQVGTGYGPGRYTADMYNAFLLRAIGDETSYSSDQKYMMYEMIYNRRPDGAKAVQGDYYSTLDGYNVDDVEAFFLASNYYKDEMLKKEYYRINHKGNLGVTPAFHLIVNDVTVGAKNFENLPLTALYEGANGTMIARSSWDEGKDSNTVLVRMNFINKLIGSHQHLDSGSFEIYYKGGLALDSGVYNSETWDHEDGSEETNLAYGSEHDMNYNKLSVAHNVMLVKMPDEQLGFTDTYVNDGGQQGPKGLGELNTTLVELKDLQKENINIGTILSRDIGDNLNKPDYSYIKGDITKAYSDDKMDKYIRSFMYLNFFDEDYPAALIVFDDIKSKNKDYEKSWILHTEEEPIVNETTNEILVSRTEKGYTGSMVNKTLLPLNSDTKYTLIGGEGHEFEVNGVNFTAVPESGYEAGKYRVEISTKSKNEQDYYLNVMEIGKNGEKYSVSPELTVNNEDFAGVKVKDRVVYFKKGEDKHTGKFEINLDSNDEKLKYIVTGLKDGKWTITSDGKVIDEKLVSKQSDVLTFTAESGSYTLEYESADTLNKDFFFMNNMSEETGNQVVVKINNIMNTFKNIPIVKDGEVFICLEEFLEKVGIEPNVATENKVSFIKDLREITFETSKKSVNVNGATLPLANTVISHNGKVYISPVDTQGLFGATVLYNDIGRVLNIDVKTVEMPSDKILTIKKNDGGNVLPGGFVVAKGNSPVDITVTPDDGYYVDEVLFNGSPFGVYSQLGVVTLRTPAITENSTLEVKFAKKEEAKAPDVETVPYMAKYVDKDGTDGIFLMGRINSFGFNVTEYGVLYSTLNPEPTYNGFNVKKAPSKYSCSDAGYYGFTFKNPNNRENIYVKAYAVYDDGKVVLADKTINLGEFKIDDITATYNNIVPELKDNVYVDRGNPDTNYSAKDDYKLMLSGSYNSQKYGRILYLEFDISGIEGISSKAELQLYAAPSSYGTVKNLSIYALEDEFDEKELTYKTAEPFGKCIGTLVVPDTTEYQTMKYDITEYLREHIKYGKKYMSIGVGIDEDWQRQIYPNGHPKDNANFSIIIQKKSTSNNQPKIVLY